MDTPMDVVQYLRDLGFDPETHAHPPVMTVAESLVHVPELPGCKTKNLFLRDKKRRRHFLVVVPHDLVVDLRGLGQALDVSGLGFASAERLRECLGVAPGAVSVLAIVHDTSHAVELVLDRRVWDAPFVQAHPLDNARTTVLTHAMLERFAAATGHAPLIVDVPRA